MRRIRLGERDSRPGETEKENSQLLPPGPMLHTPVCHPGQRSSTGTPESALSMCMPHPAQVAFPHVLQLSFQHIGLIGTSRCHLFLSLCACLVSLFTSGRKQSSFACQMLCLAWTRIGLPERRGDRAGSCAAFPPLSIAPGVIEKAQR